MQSLAKGMEILRVLTEADGPVTATELARRTDMHQSSASRVLQTLTTAGYVRKTTHGFLPDYGVLSLAQSVTKFPLVVRLQRTIELIADEHPGYQVNLAMLFRGEITYLCRARAGQHAVTAWGFPLHVSSAALRALVDLPRDEAITALRESRRRWGWNRTNEAVPATEDEVLGWATAHVEHDVLVLDGWHENSVSGAIPINSGEVHPTVLAISGDRPHATPTELAFLLHDARRRVEALLTTTPKGQR
ncbi:helix-turn-helix domain-containing protein [Aestuariimicrobium soli]|uniref:helix-turn-helix domain-containing protein n=1 Tax=Aestuariimicrobium soli TaxID=2035834 RepID=UPI003EBB7585